MNQGINQQKTEKKIATFMQFSCFLSMHLLNRIISALFLHVE